MENEKDIVNGYFDYVIDDIEYEVARKERKLQYVRSKKTMGETYDVYIPSHTSQEMSEFFKKTSTEIVELNKAREVFIKLKDYFKKGEV